MEFGILYETIRLTKGAIDDDFIDSLMKSQEVKEVTLANGMQLRRENVSEKAEVDLVTTDADPYLFPPP
eukprot:scaffold5168_cov176-Amphora_coffeaeformis.AAC.3